MESIRQYLLSVIAAALVCGIVNTLTEKKGTYAAIVKLISGLFLTVTVISPLTKIQLTDLTTYADSFSLDAQTFVAAGTEIAEKEAAQLIKEKVEAYIQDKATSLGLQITAEVTVTDDSPPLPKTVTITGAVSPYAKRVLAQYIADELAIPEEDQLWK